MNSEYKCFFNEVKRLLCFACIIICEAFMRSTWSNFFRKAKCSVFSVAGNPGEISIVFSHLQILYALCLFLFFAYSPIV